jgi:hypothetical protein
MTPSRIDLPPCSAVPQACQKIMFYSREVYVPRESCLEDMLFTCTYIFVILLMYVYIRQRDERFGAMKGNIM